MKQENLNFIVKIVFIILALLAISYFLVLAKSTIKFGEGESKLPNHLNFKVSRLVQLTRLGKSDEVFTACFPIHHEISDEIAIKYAIDMAQELTKKGWVGESVKVTTQSFYDSGSCDRAPVSAYVYTEK